MFYRSGEITKTGGVGNISTDIIKFYFQEEDAGVWYILTIDLVTGPEFWGDTFGMP